MDETHPITGLSPDNGVFMLVVLNKYPYEMEEGIEHWVVWSNEYLDLQIVKTMLREITARGYLTYTYLNPPNSKTVYGIFHTQTFVFPCYAESSPYNWGPSRF